MQNGQYPVTIALYSRATSQNRDGVEEREREEREARGRQEGDMRGEYSVAEPPRSQSSSPEPLSPTGRERERAEKRRKRREGRGEGGEEHTQSRLRLTAGTTSPTVLSTRTPPTSLKHFLSASSFSMEDKTKLTNIINTYISIKINMYNSVYKDIT